VSESLKVMGRLLTNDRVLNEASSSRFGKRRSQRITSRCRHFGPPRVLHRIQLDGRGHHQGAHQVLVMCESDLEGTSAATGCTTEALRCLVELSTENRAQSGGFISCGHCIKLIGMMQVEMNRF
jgi:hypothetical protein